MCRAARSGHRAGGHTLHHFRSPRWLAARGGWEDADTPSAFARYAERTLRATGDLVGAVCTIDEPSARVDSFHPVRRKPFDGAAAVVAVACEAMGSERFGAYFMGDSYRVRDICIEAHQRAVKAVGEAAPGVPAGMTMALQAWEAGEDGQALYCELFDNARLPFYAAAHGDRSGHECDAGVLEDAIREAVRCSAVPIYVTEHGINTDDDALRAAHLADSLKGLERCGAEGLAVWGDTHGSLLDNFEWRSGYRPKFGLYSCDRQTFARRAKPSAARFGALVRAARGLPPR